jgi:hypothetical protein
LQREPGVVERVGFGDPALADDEARAARDRLRREHAAAHVRRHAYFEHLDFP